MSNINLVFVRHGKICQTKAQEKFYKGKQSKHFFYSLGNDLKFKQMEDDLRMGII